MRRRGYTWIVPFCAAFALLIAGAPAWAADEDLESAVEELRKEVRLLEQTSNAFLSREIDRYLAKNPSFGDAQGGGGWDAVTLHARFTAVFQGAILKCGTDEGRLDGDVDLDFAFQVTDNLELFAILTANNDAGFPPINSSFATTWPRAVA